jgi:hypothetical protein
MNEHAATANGGESTAMADIDVVKKGSRAWIWVLLAILLALFLWFMLAGTGTQQTASTEQGGRPLYAAALHAPFVSNA